MGDVKPWLWGKNLCFVTLLIFHLPLSTYLMLQLVVGGVITKVVVVVAGCQPLPTCPLHPRLPILLPHALFPSQFTLTTILGLLAPHAQALGDFGLTQAFSSSSRVVKLSGTCNLCPPDCCAFSRREFPSRFSFSCTGISWVLPTLFSSADW